MVSDYRRNLAFKAGQKAFLAGKGEHTNNRQSGTIYADDWQDGWNEESNKRPETGEAMTVAEIIPMLSDAEKRVIMRLSDKYQTAKEIGTSGSLLFELADFRRDVRGVSPPTSLVTYDEEYKWRGWRITGLGEQVKAGLA